MSLNKPVILGPGRCLLHLNNYSHYCKDCDKILCPDCISPHTNVGPGKHRLQDIPDAIPFFSKRCKEIYKDLLCQ